VSPVSAVRANGVAWLTSYAASVRNLLAILVTLAACQDHSVEQLEAVKRDVCACKAASCAEQAMNRVPAAIPSTHRTQAIARDMLECRARLEAGERPTTDPDAESAAPAEGSAALPAQATGSAAAPAR
jgi:hypothetical protein